MERDNLDEPLTATPPESIADRQAEEYSQNADFAWVTTALTNQRNDILERWLDAAARQPFHFGRKEHAVADHIPSLFDALVMLLHETAPRWIDAYAPLEDAGIRAASHEHALARARQGLAPADVVVEFRLLRQEIWRSLRHSIPVVAPTDDIVAAEILVNDALDGAIHQGLVALGAHTEQVREEFLATTIHDVRQPLTAISGEAQMLLRYLKRAEVDVERSRAAANRIRTAVNSAVTLLHTLTDMSKVALGSLDLHLGSANMEAVVRKTLSNFGSGTLSQIALHVKAEPADLTGEWDAGRLEQVVGNLIANAIKYSPVHSKINITIGRDGGVVTLSVQDYGIGIPPSDIEQIFARYTRAPNAIEHGAEGVGLGLYLCRGIVEAHGGRIWAESEGVGRGTTVIVALPIHAQDPAVV
ncbi:MAG: ATP-binding protein [Chloroflexota bacterium]